MGAVSGLVDVPSPNATAALVDAVVAGVGTGGTVTGVGEVLKKEMAHVIVGAVALMIMAPYTPNPSSPNAYYWPGLGFLVGSVAYMLAIPCLLLNHESRAFLKEIGLVS